MRAALPAVTARPHVGPLRGHRLRRLCIDPCGWRPPLHHKNVLFEVPVGAALPQLPCRHTVQVEATLTEEVLHRPHRLRIDVADAALGCAPRDDDTTRCSAVDALQELPLELTRNMFGLGSGNSKKIALRLGGGCRLAALEPVRAARFHAFLLPRAKQMDAMLLCGVLIGGPRWRLHRCMARDVRFCHPHALAISKVRT